MEARDSLCPTGCRARAERRRADGAVAGEGGRMGATLEEDPVAPDEEVEAKGGEDGPELDGASGPVQVESQPPSPKAAGAKRVALGDEEEAEEPGGAGGEAWGRGAGGSPFLAFLRFGPSVSLLLEIRLPRDPEWPEEDPDSVDEESEPPAMGEERKEGD